MKRMGLIVGIILGALVIGVGGYFGFRSNNPAHATGTPPPNTVAVIPCDVTQTVTAPGSVVNTQEATVEMPFDGKLTKILVQPGDLVNTGQLLAQADSTAQEQALSAAKMHLAELTSPEAIANAELAVTSAQAEVINAQAALKSQQYWQNSALIQDQYANMVIARANMDKAQAAYDNAQGGAYINNPDEAALYQALYAAAQKYNLAQYYYSLYSQKPTERQITAAQATLDLANARLAEAQNYLTALTGGNLPTDATGASLEALIQARQAFQSAQDALDAAQFQAPFAGVILKSEAVAGVTLQAGTALFTIHDPQDIEIQGTVTEEDFPSVEVGQKTTLYFDALPDVVASGTVSRIVPERAPGDSPLYYVYISLKNVPAKLVTGMTTDASILIAEKPHVLCLPRALVHAASNGTATITVWDGAHPETRQITIGLRGDTNVEIRSGLTGGEQVVSR